MILVVLMAGVVILVIKQSQLEREARWAILLVQKDGRNVPDTTLSILMQKNFGVMAVSKISQDLVPNLLVKMGVLVLKLKMEVSVALVHQELQEYNVKITLTVILMEKVTVALPKINV